MSESRHTILVVDDDPLIVKMFGEYLVSAGFRVVSAENGAAAWTRLQTSPDLFDAVLVDQFMSMLDGMALLAQIKEHPSLCTREPLPDEAGRKKETARDPAHGCFRLH